MSSDIRDILEYYRELGFEYLPVDKGRLADRPGPAAAAPVPEKKPAMQQSSSAPLHSTPSGADALKAVREDIGDCTRCPLCNGRTNIVFGEGDPGARLMFIGEAPGREEDIQARPFVGDAGQVLTNLIKKMGLKREEVYIANIVKCRPPGNRDPEPVEIATCSPFLFRQIDIIAPRVIVALGRISAHTLSRRKGPVTGFAITRERGRFFSLSVEGRDYPVMPTFHPAYLMRNPKDKWLTWEDAQAVLARLKGE